MKRFLKEVVFGIVSIVLEDDVRICRNPHEKIIGEQHLQVNEPVQVLLKDDVFLFNRANCRIPVPCVFVTFVPQNLVLGTLIREERENFHRKPPLSEANEKALEGSLVRCQPTVITLALGRT